MTVAIETDVPPPAEEVKAKPKSRARKAAASPKKTANPAASLIAALKFISPAQKKTGLTSEMFCHIAHNWAAASDGILMIAAKIEEDLQACPNTLQFIEALSKVSDVVSIAQLSPNALAVTSGGFRALVPCVGFDEVILNAPDPMIAPINDNVKEAFAALVKLVSDSETDSVKAGILLQANTAVATNGLALLEYWHGVDLPPGLLIPRMSAQAIAKTTKSLVGFGYSRTSATFYFEDESFIKTGLYAEAYPAYEMLFSPYASVNYWPVPEDFFKGVHALEAFSPHGNIYFENGSLLSKQRTDEASSYVIEGLPERMGFGIKILLSVEHAFKKVYFDAPSKKAVFMGESIRGIAMGLDLEREVKYNSGDVVNEKDFVLQDEDIQF